MSGPRVYASWVVPAALMGACLSSNASAAGFSLDIPTIKPHSTLSEAQVYNSFGCKGKNISPAMTWSGAPDGTKSFAVTVYDPDAPTGSGWWHWVLYNIPATVRALPEHAGDVDGRQLPTGAAQGRTDFGTPGFGGACPPAGDKPHRYIFTVYALKTETIDVPPGSTAAMVGYMLNATQLAKSSVTALYGR